MKRGLRSNFLVEWVAKFNCDVGANAEKAATDDAVRYSAKRIRFIIAASNFSEEKNN
jgi:hypothetical protein